MMSYVHISAMITDINRPGTEFVGSLLASFGGRHSHAPDLEGGLPVGLCRRAGRLAGTATAILGYEVYGFARRKALTRRYS